MGFAGDTFNTAWHLRQLRPDVQTGYCSRVGQDAVSQAMLEMMVSAGIDTEHVGRSADRSVGLYLITLDDGERSFSYWRGASAARQLAQDPAALARALGETDIAYFSGITVAILDPAGRETLLAAMAFARDAGKIVAFDPNLRPGLWKDTGEMCAAITAAAAVSDMVLPSYDDEAVHFGDRDMAATADRYLEAGARTVITGQWDVYDATGPPLLRDFFDRLSRGDPAPAALAEAQRRFLAQLRDSTAAEPWLHPYFWSVYTVAGDDRATCSTESELQAQVLQNFRGESP